MGSIAVEQFMVCESVDEIEGQYRGHAIRLRTGQGEIRENLIALVRIGRPAPPAAYSFRVFHEDVTGSPRLLAAGPALRVTPQDDGAAVFVLHAGPVRMSGPGRYVFVLQCDEKTVAEREYVFGPEP